MTKKKLGPKAGDVEIRKKRQMAAQTAVSSASVPPLTAPTWQESSACVEPTGVRCQRAVRTYEPAIARHADGQDQRTSDPRS
jgi:hypothetical protein